MKPTLLVLPLILVSFALPAAPTNELAGAGEQLPRSLAPVDSPGSSVRGSTEPASSCEPSSTDASEPSDASDIDAFFTRYLPACGEKMRSALESTYQREARNTTWAKPLEARIEQVAASDPTLVVRGSCHSNVCRYDFEYSGRNALSHNGFELNQALLSSVKGTKVSVSVIFFTKRPGFVKYFVSDVLPATYLKQLKADLFGDQFVKMQAVKDR